LHDNLAADGFRVAGASGAGEGRRAIEARQLALVALDLAPDDGSAHAGFHQTRAWVVAGERDQPGHQPGSNAGLRR
jgi:hypothetical protein